MRAQAAVLLGIFEKGDDFFELVLGFLDPGDIAEIAVFLASDESRMLTGTTIAADGGRSSYLKFDAGDD